VPDRSPNTKAEATPLVPLGVAHGRFQLFHNGHLEYIMAAKERCQKLVIGITSPDPFTLQFEPVDPHRSDPAQNPMTYYERMLMITNCLRYEGIDASSFHVVPFPIEQPDRLFNYSPRDATYFLTIYDKWGEEKLQRLKDLGLSTQVLWRRQDKRIKGSDIRIAIANGSDWQSLVPPATAEYVRDHKIDARIQRALRKGQTR